ncbi:hypothetical protein Q7O_001471 [Pectobacterium carotovorum subsp. carotovorum PCCS1]|nr:hypothetical protein [Pectobacterium carotovorum subsp. carotovorum PCCS1]
MFSPQQEKDVFLRLLRALPLMRQAGPDGREYNIKHIVG